MTAIPFAPPPNTSILSFSLTITGISLSPATGSDINIPLAATTYILDTTKLQSDSAFIGQVLVGVPAGTYNKVAIAVSSASVTFCTQPSPGTPGCSNNSVAIVNSNPQSSVPSSPISLTLAANDRKGLQLQFNMVPGLTLNGQTITALTLAPASGTVLGAVALPPLKSSLATGQLDFVEDFTGIVTAGTGSAVTVKTSEHGAITATSNSSTTFSPNCLVANISCVAVGQLASIDAALNADGTFTMLEYDPLEASASDWIEGTVTSAPTSTTQFQIVTNDIFLKASGSKIGANLLPAAPVAVNLGAGVTFVVDTKGQTVPTESGAFAASNDTSVLKPGQTVAVRVSTFTPAAGTAFAIATVDIVELRFTRITGTVSLVAAPNSFSIQNLPPYFGATTPLIVQLNQTLPPSTATNYDGLAVASDLAVGQTVSIRALYFGTASTRPFSAAKVRTH
ncbi:MAG: hypothetical protein PVS2B2_17270 [Candidatus Acidiferrum sp.]